MPYISPANPDRSIYSQRADHHCHKATKHQGSAARHQRSQARNQKRAERESHSRHHEIPKDWEPSSFLGQAALGVASVVVFPFTLGLRLAGEYPFVAAAVAVGAVLGGALAEPASNSKKMISSANELQKLNATGDFMLGKDIDMSGVPSNNTAPFSGTLDGNGHTVKGLTNCLFKELTGNVSNIKFSDANITGRSQDGPLGVVACNVTKSGQIANATVQSSEIHLSGFNAKGGFATGKMTGNGKVINFTSVNNTIKASNQTSIMGFAVGVTEGSAQVQNITALGCTMEGSEGYMAVAVGEMKGSSKVNGAICVQSQLSASTSTKMGVGGGNLGTQASVSNIVSVSCALTNMGSRTDTGIGAGKTESTSTSQVSLVTCLNSTIRYNATSENKASIGVGHALTSNPPTNVTALNCAIEGLINNGTVDPDQACAHSDPSILSSNCSFIGPSQAKIESTTGHSLTSSPISVNSGAGLSFGSISSATVISTSGTSGNPTSATVTSGAEPLPASTSEPLSDALSALSFDDLSKYGVGASLGAGMMGAFWFLTECFRVWRKKKHNPKEEIALNETQKNESELLRQPNSVEDTSV